MMVSLASRVLVTNEYSSHQSLDVQDVKNSSSNENIDMSQKGNVENRTAPSNHTEEKVICGEILSLAKYIKEVSNYNFTNTTGVYLST